MWLNAYFILFWFSEGVLVISFHVLVVQYYFRLLNKMIRPILAIGAYGPENMRHV